MPSELRLILFRPAEVASAVQDYYRRTGTPLAVSSVVRCGPKRGDSGSVSRLLLVVAPEPDEDEAPKPSAEKQREVAVEAAVVAAALILYCRDRRIPLPTSAHKSLRCFGEHVGLVATINPKLDGLPKLERLWSAE